MTTSGGSPKAIALGDLNGNGRPDIAALHTTESKLSLLLFSGGTFGSETGKREPPSAGHL